MTRPITPHKGGRRHWLPNARITDATKAQLAAIRQHYVDQGERWNLADWVAEKVAEEYERVSQEEKQSDKTFIRTTIVTDAVIDPAPEPLIDPATATVEDLGGDYAECR